MRAMAILQQLTIREHRSGAIGDAFNL